MVVNVISQISVDDNSTKERFDDLSEYVKANHPYDCVEVLLLITSTQLSQY